MRRRNLGLVLSYTNTFLNMITGLFMSSFLLRQLGDTEYGVYQTIASFANYLVLLEFGTGTVMARNLSACRAKGETRLEIERNISTIWTITNILVLLIAAVSAIFYCLINVIYSGTLTASQIESGKTMLIFITLYLLASFYVQTLNGIMLAHENYTYSSSTSIVRITLRTGLLVVLILNWKHAILIALVDAGLAMGLAVFGYIYATKRFGVKITFKYFDALILKSSLPLCLAIFLQAVVNQANSNVGKFILGVSVGPEEVSMYSVGLYVFSIFSSLSTIPVSLYVPQVTKDVLAGKEGKELTDSLVQPSRLIVIVSGAVLFGFFAVGRQFIEIVYGKHYLLAWAIALILIAPMFINMTISMVINVLDVKNKRLARSIIMLFTTAINIVLTIVLIRKCGILGAAISTGLCMLLQVISLSIYYSKAIGIKVAYMLVNTYKGILIYQIAGAVLGFVVGHLIPNVYVSFVAGGITYVLVAFGGFCVFGKNEQEATMIKKLLHKFSTKKDAKY